MAPTPAKAQSTGRNAADLRCACDPFPGVLCVVKSQRSCTSGDVLPGNCCRLRRYGYKAKVQICFSSEIGLYAVLLVALPSCVRVIKRLCRAKSNELASHSVDTQSLVHRCVDWQLTTAFGLLNGTRCNEVLQLAGMVYKPSCVNKFSITKLLQYQRPRSILLISPDVDACTNHLGAISPLVRCIQEDSVLPHVTKAFVQETLQQAYPQIHAASQEGMWSRTGWYLQQVCRPLCG